MDPVTSGPAAPYHHLWTQLNQEQPPHTATESPLLALGYTSDIDPLLPEQVADARRVMLLRQAAVRRTGPESAHDWQQVRVGQRRVVERFLAGRRAYFGVEQSRPLSDAAALAREGRDIFVVVKFMDEAPHLAATLDSLRNQRNVDPERLVVIGVDNNSTDGSDDIARDALRTNSGGIRMVYLNQSQPGAGNAARLGVDTCIATVHEMCRADGRWDRLQSATIGVSDGDTVYHPTTVDAVARILDADPTVDGVMPFLTYKFTAALRLFSDYRPARPEVLAGHVTSGAATPVPVDLSNVPAHDLLPRAGRRPGPDCMTLTGQDGWSTVVPLLHTDGYGRRFGVLRDPAGRLGYLLEDRSLVLAEAPVSGFDSALVFLENGGVRPEEKWRWHSVVGHDLFLYWAFAGMGLPETMVYPDTSDALKTFRVWSFAIGGQHQLSRPGVRIVTGSDYQSGRVVQAVGGTVRLAPAAALAETETDRLIKMIRNFARRQSVFYGETRGAALDRASGLYVHMTRIQDDLERELRSYDDTFFEQIAFPERVLFPLRWMLQNAVRFYAHGEAEQQVVRERVLRVMFTSDTADAIERNLLSEAAMRALATAPYAEKQALAEGIAERVIAARYPEIMAFYVATLRGFFAAHRVAPQHVEWLLDGLVESRNAIVEQPPPVDPTTVWDGPEFDIDVDRGQVVRMRE